MLSKRGDFVKQLQEGEMGSIVLKEENPEVIAKLVDYFYKFDYDDGNNDNQQQPIAHGSAPRKLAFNALMYVAGDKYDIGGLKLLAKAKFAAALVDGWNKEDLPEVIRFIYENTVSSDRELRECLVPTLIQHKQALRSDDAFRKVVGTVGEFAVDLIDAWTVPNHQGSQTSFLQCNYCLKLYPNTHTGVCQGSGYHCRSYEPTLRVVYTPP